MRKKKVQCQTADTYRERRANSHFSIRISTLNKYTVLTLYPNILFSVHKRKRFDICGIKHNVTHTVRPKWIVLEYICLPIAQNSTISIQCVNLPAQSDEVKCEIRDFCWTKEIKLRY